MSDSQRELDGKIRQEEWAKVLNKNKIEEKVVEDLRPLKIRLKEQQDKKAQAWKETFKSIIGIDDEDAEHLKNVSEMKTFMENEIKREDSREIEEFRRKVALQQLEELEKKPEKMLFSTNKLKSTSVNKQKTLLLSGIKRKHDQIDVPKPTKETKDT